MKKNRQRLQTVVLLTAMLAAAGFLLFHNLGTKPLRIWDESRMAVNSLEMYHDGFSIVPTYKGEPDMWNTKPPLLIWLQTAALHLAGVSEWSIRLPSALAGIGIALLIFFFVRKFTSNDLIAAISALTPLTSEGFLMLHNVRSGEYDALLALLVTAYALVFFSYTQNRNVKLLYLFFLLVSLAILTKSTAALIPLPGLAIWAFADRSAIKLLSLKHFWLAAGMMLLIIGSYYIGREVINPGYLKAVDLNEIRGRFLEVSEGNRGGFMFYINNIFDGRFSYWVWFLIPAIPLSLFNRTTQARKAALFSLLFWVTFLLLISLAKTKLRWYDVPAYPFFAITIGIGLGTIWQFVSRTGEGALGKFARVSFYALAVFALIHPYRSMADRVTTLEEMPWDEELYHVQYLLKDAINGEGDLSGYQILYDNLHQRTVFYLIQLKSTGEDPDHVYLWRVRPGDSLIVYNPAMLELLKEKYYISEVEEPPYITISMIKIDGYRN